MGPALGPGTRGLADDGGPPPSSAGMLRDHEWSLRGRAVKGGLEAAACYFLRSRSKGEGRRNTRL